MARSDRDGRREQGPLTWLYQRRDKQGRRLITEAERQAGERLAADFHAALLNPRVTSAWSGTAPSRRQRRGPPGFASELPDHVIGAKQRFGRALEAVGREHAGLLVDVCCFEKSLGDVEQSAGWPQRSAKIVLQLALRQLARHYGLIRDEGRFEVHDIRHWAADGYRPEP